MARAPRQPAPAEPSGPGLSDDGFRELAARLFANLEKCLESHRLVRRRELLAEYGLSDKE